jgi:predicted nuclease of restriction endonuclease-like RecB superfamily
MLTGDLLRVWTEGPNTGPRYLKTDSPEYLAMARDLIELVLQHRSRTRGELKQALKNYTGDSTNYKVQRGLAKLLVDLCEFSIESPVAPDELRRRLFALARENHPVTLSPDLLHPVTSRDVLSEVATEFKTTAEQMSHWMYADLRDSQVLVDYDPPSPEWLLMRYNVALAQALLYRCSEMRLTVLRNLPARYKQLFKFIKFYRLMHTITGDLDSGYEIVLDGPVSLFRLSQKYGLQMAGFLPALLLCTKWRMRAEILGADGNKYYFHLDEKAGLVSHYTDATRYDSLLEQRFAERFEKLESPWQLERETEIINLKETVFIPDFAFHHPDGRYALLEIVGFWRPDYLQRKIKKLRRAKLDHLIVAVSADLNASEEDFRDVPGAVFFFKTAIDPKEIVERLEQVAKPFQPA